MHVFWKNFSVKCMEKETTDTNLSTNEVRFNIYCQRSRRTQFAMLPSCSEVLKQHIVRVNYQTLIWRECLDNLVVLKKQREYCWCINEKKLAMKWMACNPALEEKEKEGSLKIFKKCKSRTCKRGNFVTSSKNCICQQRLYCIVNI